ncbi:hypothetical protein [Neobacillus cucumis]|uniref:hypothetical protein n=1 Tax=Neobacillus cucumis TaxID=1740721 RepID=UPI000C76ABBC|nr:hypothetical protein [Neobacillus cucumis]
MILSYKFIVLLLLEVVLRYTSFFDQFHEGHSNVDRNERRTFITPPYNSRIELQVNLDVIDSLNNGIKIELFLLQKQMQWLQKKVMVMAMEIQLLSVFKYK